MKNLKFNVIDVLILVLAVLVVLAGVYVYYDRTHSDVSSQNSANVSFTIEINGLSYDAANSFKVGDAVTLGETTSGSGKITNVEVVDYEKVSVDSKDGKYILTKIPDEYTARVTILSEVVKSDESYKSGSEIIAVGREMPFNGKGAAASDCYIVDLAEVK